MGELSASPSTEWKKGAKIACAPRPVKRSVVDAARGLLDRALRRPVTALDQ
jgi:hypothetical protein